MSLSLEVLGDRWSLLIVRDLMIRGFRTFTEFQVSEGIASNILADRLHKLERAGIVASKVDPGDARKLNYRLTEKGIDLAPVLLEFFVWGSKYEDSGVSCVQIELMSNHREQVLAEVRRRWRDDDRTPLFPLKKNTKSRKDVR